MKIAAASQQSGLSADTLRYYERIGLIPPITRNRSGNRDYTIDDINRIEFVKCLRAAGVPIDALLEFFRLNEHNVYTTKARKEILVEQRKQLVQKIADMQETLNLLNYKIGYYENLLVEMESSVASVEN